MHEKVCFEHVFAVEDNLSYLDSLCQNQYLTLEMAIN